MEVVTRAEAISKDFAQKFKEKQAQKKTSKVPLLIQADFAYLVKLATGTVPPDANPQKLAETLRIMKQFIRNQPL